MEKTFTTIEAEARMNRIKKQRENAEKTIYNTIVSLMKTYGRVDGKDEYYLELDGNCYYKVYNHYRDEYSIANYVEMRLHLYPEEYDGEKWGISCGKHLRYNDGSIYGCAELGCDDREELLQRIIETINKHGSQRKAFSL